MQLVHCSWHSGESSQPSHVKSGLLCQHCSQWRTAVSARHCHLLCAVQEFHAYITNGGKPVECNYPLKGIGFLPCGW